MTENPINPSAGFGRLKRTALILSGLFLLYVMLGFWVAPPLLKTRLEKKLTQILARKVTIGEIKLNPLVLSATTSDLTVHEIDGTSFAGFGQLYVNVELSSLFRWAGTVKEIRLSAPFGVLKLMSGGTMNIDDLIARFSQTAVPSDTQRGLPRAIIARLEVIDGKFTFTDLASSAPVHDVIAPITFTLENLSTLQGRQGQFRLAGEGPIGGQFDLIGNLELNPPKIKGRFATKGARLSHHWEHIKDLVSFQVIDGTISMSADFFASIDGSGLNARLEKGSLQLENFELAEKGHQKVLVALPVFSIEGIHGDFKTHEVSIERVQTTNACIKLWLAPNGTFALQDMLLTDLKKLIEKKGIIAPGPEDPLQPPWQLTVEKMHVTDWELAFEDRILTRPAKLTVNKIHAVIQNLSTQKGTQATVSAGMQINRAGQVNIDGTAGITPLKADMKVVATKVALTPFQPYVDDAINARIATGAASCTGRIRYHAKDAKPQIHFDGDISIDEIEVQDQLQTNDFITLKQLKTSNIALALSPNSLTVSAVLVDQPHASITIDEAGVINVVKAFAPVEKPNSSGKENLLKRLVRFLITEFKGPMPIQVDQIRLDRFSGDFMDASIAPPFRMQMEIAEGVINGLSSKPSDRADFKMGGSIDSSATIEASGQMNPMNALKYSNVNLSLKNFALPSISPYSGKYIGYKINKGDLQTSLKYNLTDDQVNGDNIITIDELKLGEAVDSPDALNLPIKLGVTLLKDKNGRIALQVPVVGNVKGPHFDLAKAIKSALTGTIETAGSQPFAAISEIDGFTGEQLRMVAFSVGLSALRETETRKLDALASYLKEKEALTLGIVGMADRIMDGAAVMGKSPLSPPASSSSQDKDRTPESAGVDPVDNKRLKALAQRRAAKVSTYLIEKAGIDSARIKIEPVQIKPNPPDNNAFVEFNLSAN